MTDAMDNVEVPAVQRKPDEIVRRIDQVAEPERILFFGSAARGTAHPNSDLGPLVIMQGDFHRTRLTERISHQSIGVGRAVDVIVVMPAALLAVETLLQRLSRP